ncbi:MAG: PilN domain-containing protein [Burkholderiaceae bacterium]
MIARINLLPHRELRRERRKKDFVGLLALIALLAACTAMLVAFVIDQQIENQRARNTFIRAENTKLDAQIKEIASLRADIDALRSRQEAVESLQTNRTIPVHLLDELVRNVPEGIYLKQMRQEQRKVTLVGYAQSNERVSELLRNLANNTPWLERPELIEIKATRLGGQQGPNAREGRRVYEFALNAVVKSNEAPDAQAKPGANAAAKTAAAGSATGPLASAANAGR